MITKLLQGSLLSLCLVECKIMNQGGLPYAISNPPGSTEGWQGTPGTYSTDFETNVAGDVEHFDVYGEVQTLYSQVYWTRNLPINLPKKLVDRFNGSIMAITGYEVDQVIHPGPKVSLKSAIKTVIIRSYLQIIIVVVNPLTDILFAAQLCQRGKCIGRFLLLP